MFVLFYDAFCKFQIRESSLNEHLYRRSVILLDHEIQLYGIAILVDEKALLQLGIQLSDRDVTRLKDIAKVQS